ncbi:laccase [Mycena vitilis]|nr:laccase [Mycena vitilis]
MAKFSALTLLPFLIGQAIAAEVYYDIPVNNVRVAPDGFPRDAISAGPWPGQLIIANKGDVLHLNVTNNLANPTMRRSTSIHWHGIFQDRTATEDGPSFVNQCPIAPGHFYQYNFPLFNQTGSYWFHSHLSTQYIDGERGTLVICNPDDPQKSMWDFDDQSTIITLADWYHSPAEGLMAQFKKDGHEPVPDSGLINGVGRYVGGPAVPWAVVNVIQGKNLRVINIAGFAAFTFSVDGHVFDVIETDGIATEPLTVSSFLIHAAQRYSVVLKADAAVGNYWIRAPMTAQGTSKTLDKNNVKAILRYQGAAVADPNTSSTVVVARKNGGDDKTTTTSTTTTKTTTTSTSTTSTAASTSTSNSGGGGGGGSGGGGKNAGPLQEYQLKTLIDPGAPGGDAPADHVIDLQFGTAGPGLWQINGISYVPPTLPTLLNMINGGDTAANYTKAEHTFILKANEVVELRIHGSANGITHPFHLHGHAFDVVQSASGPVNYKNPPRRDVIAVEGGGVIIRFRGMLSLAFYFALQLIAHTADNPGPWFLHCHIDWHLEAGLAVVFAEAPDDFRGPGPKSGIVTQQYLDLCPAYNALPAELQ